MNLPDNLLTQSPPLMIGGKFYKKLTEKLVQEVEKKEIEEEIKENGVTIQRTSYQYVPIIDSKPQTLQKLFELQISLNKIENKQSSNSNNQISQNKIENINKMHVTEIEKQKNQIENCIFFKLI